MRPRPKTAPLISPGLSRYCRLGIRDRTSDDKTPRLSTTRPPGQAGSLKAIGYRAYLQAAKRRSGPVWEFLSTPLRYTGSTTHARLEHPTQNPAHPGDPLAHRQGI